MQKQIKIKYDPTIKKFEGHKIPDMVFTFFDVENASHDEVNGVITLLVGWEGLTEERLEKSIQEKIEIINKKASLVERLV